MSYFYMSNINSFTTIVNPEDSYLEVGVYSSTTDPEDPAHGVVKFTKDNVDYSASFLMIRAKYSNDVLIELNPSHYGVYIPANELWSVDSLEAVDKFYIRKIFDNEGNSINNGYIQWMIGYK